MLFFGYEFLKELYENVFAAPSVTLRSEPPKLISFASGNPCRVPPSSRRKAIMLLPDSMKKEYEQNARTPFAFSAGKACFMEGPPSEVLFSM